jgi:protocatechuate 3,4-dioxygenase beta subunit
MMAVLAAVPAAAQTGRVLGRVTDGAGNAVAQARVALVAADSAAAVRIGSTGETGGFDFAAVPPGDYTLRVERAGYRVRELRVALGPGARETVIARLSPAPRRERLAQERTAPATRP